MIHGQYHTPETLAKMREVQKRRCNTPEWKARKSAMQKAAWARKGDAMRAAVSDAAKERWAKARPPKSRGE